MYFLIKNNSKQKKQKKNKFFIKMNICLLKYLLLFMFIIVNFIIKYEGKNHRKTSENYHLNKYKLYNQIKLDYDHNKFAIIRNNCKHCGLFAFYKHYLGCLLTFIKKGYIPIIDLSSFPNIFNKFNITSLNNNPWEYYFNQPYEYTLENVIKKAKNIKYFECYYSFDFPRHNIYSNKNINDFWRGIALKYIPLKNEIIKEADSIIIHLFKASNNILGILARGTDYVSFKPKNHPIPPKAEIMIKDIKEMDNQNNYDWFFLTTEDDLIRLIFIKNLGYKLKYLVNKKNIKYDYKKKNFLCFNKNIRGNLDYIKIYLINIIILSKCIDIVCARTSGAIGAFILGNGFRNTKIYYLGNY